MLKICIAFLLATTAVLSQPLPPAPMETVWEGMYAPPYLTSPQIGLAMDCVSSKKCYIGGASNGAGAGIFVYDGQMNGQLTQMPMPNQSAMVFDIAVGGSETNPTGVFTSVDLMVMLSQGIQYLANNGTEWLASLMPLEFVWKGMSLSKYSDSRTYIAMGAGIQNDIVTSTDGGLIFSAEPINWDNDGYKNCSYPNGMVTPSPNAWYMTWGAEPASKRDPSSSSSSGGSSMMSENNNNNDLIDDIDAKYHCTKTERVIGRKIMGRVLIIQNIVTRKTRVHTKTIKQFYADKKAQQLKADSVCNFYSGAILKSTDQGKTWKEVATLPSQMPSYINCWDENHCTAIAFNADVTATFVTTDGVTWTTTYQTPPPTSTYAEMAQAVDYASQTEVWVGGNSESQSSTQGMFWSSTNSGATFTPYKHFVPDVEAIMAIVFTPDNVGFAIGLTMFKTTQIMRYKKQADYGNFIQAHCPVAGCAFLCQNITFPLGFCLSTNGGSAKAFCQNGELLQYTYTTTSCVGSYTKNAQPINKCLNGTNTFFENYCPGGAGFSAAGSRKATDKDRFLF